MYKIKEIKDKLVDRMQDELSMNGATRININEFGALADIVKDLSEALYYCTVTEAMGSNDNKQQLMGYSQDGGMRGYSGSQSNMGYSGGQNGMMGHTDPIATIRDMLASADPMARADLYKQISELFH